MKAITAALLIGAFLHAAELKPDTLRAFENYVRGAEQKLEARPEFLWCAASPDRLARARKGEVMVEPTLGHPETKIPDGLVHDWVGCVFIPGGTLEQTLALVQDYNNHKNIYKPELVESKILRHNGNEYLVYMRLLKKKVITVVLDTEHEVRYFAVDKNRWRSRSRTTRIAEVEHAGKSNESAKPPGTGQGFLWQLYSYWRFEERDGGTWVECEAISLTRDVPTGLGWMINPIIQDLPKESLLNTLRQTRTAISGRP